MPKIKSLKKKYQLFSTGIDPHLQLARYSAVCKYWQESDFSTWAKVGIHNKLGTAPVPKDLQYWRDTGIVLALARPTTGAAPKGNLDEVCPLVLARYWTSLLNLYWFSTGITPSRL